MALSQSLSTLEFLSVTPPGLATRISTASISREQSVLDMNLNTVVPQIPRSYPALAGVISTRKLTAFSAGITCVFSRFVLQDLQVLEQHKTVKTPNSHRQNRDLGRSLDGGGSPDHRRDFDGLL